MSRNVRIRLASECPIRASFRSAMDPAPLMRWGKAYRGNGSVVASGVMALKVIVRSGPLLSTPLFH